MLKLKNNIKIKDLEELGFYIDRDQTILSEGLKRIWIKKDGVLHFNMPTNNTFDVVFELVSRGYVERIPNPPRRVRVEMSKIPTDALADIVNSDDSAEVKVKKILEGMR